MKIYIDSRGIFKCPDWIKKYVFDREMAQATTVQTPQDLLSILPLLGLAQVLEEIFVYNDSKAIEELAQVLEILENVEVQKVSVLAIHCEQIPHWIKRPNLHVDVTRTISMPSSPSSLLARSQALRYYFNNPPIWQNGRRFYP